MFLWRYTEEIKQNSSIEILCTEFTQLFFHPYVHVIKASLNKFSFHSFDNPLEDITVLNTGEPMQQGKPYQTMRARVWHHCVHKIVHCDFPIL